MKVHANGYWNRMDTNEVVMMKWFRLFICLLGYVIKKVMDLFLDGFLKFFWIRLFKNKSSNPIRLTIKTKKPFYVTNLSTLFLFFFFHFTSFISVFGSQTRFSYFYLSETKLKLVNQRFYFCFFYSIRRWEEIRIDWNCLQLLAYFKTEYWPRNRE